MGLRRGWSAEGGDRKPWCWQALPVQTGCSPAVCYSPETLQLTSEVSPQGLLDMIRCTVPQEEK